jgi:hypothetical protein
VIAPDDLYDLLSKTGKWKQLVIRKKESVSAEDLSQARALALALFHTAVPSTGEEAFKHIAKQIEEWKSRMAAAKAYAEQKSRYPGLEVVTEVMRLTTSLLKETDSNRFIKSFLTHGNELAQIQPDYAKVSGFYESQRPAWDKLLNVYESARVNEGGLRSRNPEAAAAIATLKEILTSPQPYSRVVEANALATAIDKAVLELVKATREEATQAVAEAQEDLDKSLIGIPDPEAVELQKPLLDLRNSIDRETSTGNLLQVRERATELYNAAIKKVNARAQENGTPPPPKAKPIRTIKPKTKTLESKEDVDAYLAELKTQIMDAIDLGEKVQVQ